MRNAPPRVGANDPLRNGCSTKRHDRYESATVSANSATLSKASSTRLLLENRAKANSGQCHRYSEYEIWPKNFTTLNGESRPLVLVGTPMPLQMKVAAPMHGSSALSPG